MDFSISEEARLILQTVSRFVAEELQPLEVEIDRTGIMPPETAKAVFEKSRALGLYGMNMPVEFGGAGLNAVDMCLIEEQIGQTSDILVRRAFGDIYEILLACEGSQIDRWLKPAVSGERISSLAITEPEAGSDAAGIKTRAVREGDGWRLNGHKHFISDGGISDFFIVSAVTDPDAGARGISIFLVDGDSPGFTVGRDQPMMGLRGTTHVELFFEDIKLGPENLLGPEGRGLNLALETLGRIRLAHIGARSIGMASRVLDLMIEHARDRRQFGQPIGDFQMIQTMLADSALEINAARHTILDTAWQIDQGRDPREKISMSKIFGPETFCRVADRAVQVFGGLGFCKDLPIERFYRDSRITRIYDGTSEIHRMVIARSLLKNGADFMAPL